MDKKTPLNPQSKADPLYGEAEVTSPQPEPTFNKEERKKIDERIQALPANKYPQWVEESKVQKIRRLDCFEQVREWLIEGLPAGEVARRLVDQGYFEDYSVQSVQQYVSHYRATIPPWAFISRRQPTQYLNAVKAADHGVDVLKEMADLIKLQKKRVEIGFQREQQFGLLSSGMEKNVAVAATLINQFAEMKERLGLSEHQIQQNLPPDVVKDVDWKHVYGRESVTKVLGNPESRARVVQVAERLLDMYANKLSREPKVFDWDAPPSSPPSEDNSANELVEVDSGVTIESGDEHGEEQVQDAPERGGGQ